MKTSSSLIHPNLGLFFLPRDSLELKLRESLNYWNVISTIYCASPRPFHSKYPILSLVCLHDPTLRYCRNFLLSGNVHLKEHSYVRENISAKINMPLWLTFRDSMSVFISLFATPDAIYNCKAAELPNALQSMGSPLSSQDKFLHSANKFNIDIIRSNFIHLLPSFDTNAPKDPNITISEPLIHNLVFETVEKRRKEFSVQWASAIGKVNIFSKGEAPWQTNIDLF